MDTRLLSELRRDARVKYADLNRRLGIPPTTAVHRLRRLRPFIHRHVALLDYERLGFPIRKLFVLKGRPPVHRAVNTVLRTHRNEFLVEAIFASMRECDAFIETLADHESYDLIEEIAQEAFLPLSASPVSSPSHRG